MEFRGFTLVQLMVGISIISILLTVGIPSFADFQNRQNLHHTLIQSQRLLIEARQLAILKKQTVNVVANTGDTWCVGVTFASTCDCFTPTDCQINEKPLRLNTQNGGIVLSDSRKSTVTKVSFDASYGTAYGTANTLAFSNSTGTGKVIVNNLGRVRTCADTSSSLDIRSC